MAQFLKSQLIVLTKVPLVNNECFIGQIIKPFRIIPESWGKFTQI